MERKCDYIPLSRQPLVFVLGQVSISPREKMADYVPEIQEKFARSGYPNFKESKVAKVQFGPGNIETHSETLWKFLNQDRTTNVILLKDSFGLQTTAYKRFEDFAEQLKLAASIILSKTEHDQFGRILRIGLRYVNLVQPGSGEDFRDYLKEGFHGVSNGLFKQGTGRVHLQHRGETDLDGSVGRMLVQVYQDDSGEPLPPDLTEHAPQPTRRVERGELVTFVDTDHHLKADLDPAPEVIEKYAYLLHDPIADAFHKHLVTGQALEVWK